MGEIAFRDREADRTSVTAQVDLDGGLRLVDHHPAPGSARSGRRRTATATSERAESTALDVVDQAPAPALAVGDLVDLELTADLRTRAAADVAVDLRAVDLDPKTAVLVDLTGEAPAAAAPVADEVDEVDEGAGEVAFPIVDPEAELRVIRDAVGPIVPPPPRPLLRRFKRTW